MGTFLASFIGTTGASMVLIRPLLRGNDNRRYNVHVVVFFIFLVSNIGGALTPLGDPPLFLGFLKGVDFLWTTKHLFWQTAFLTGSLLLIFFFLDSYLYRKEAALGLPPLRDPTPDNPRFSMKGKINILFISLIIIVILTTSSWKTETTLTLFHSVIKLPDLMRELGLIALTLLSLFFTRKSTRIKNGFTWGPMIEVAMLFAGIFICMLPVLAMLQAGSKGVFAPLINSMQPGDSQHFNVAYFWVTGILSSFLDNAPTYLVFFELAGGDPAVLMTAKSGTLAAISAGAVFMGANSYLGNAPNFMVYTIARHRHIKMPSFFGYLLWSCGILFPLFFIISLFS